MIYLRALGLLIAEKMCCYGDRVPCELTYSSALALLRRLREAEGQREDRA